MENIIEVIDETFNKLNTKVDDVKLPEGTWEKKPTIRGKDIDDFMKNNVGSNYPVIDRIDDNGIVTSVKSRDLNCKSYQNGKTLENTIKKDIDKLEGYKGFEWGKTVIENKEITGKQLQIVVPNTSLSETQIKAINNAIAQTKDIEEVLLKVYKKLGEEENKPLINRLENYITFTAFTEKIKFTESQEGLINSLRKIGGKAGLNGAYRSD